VLAFVLIPVVTATAGTVGLGHFVFVQALCTTMSVIGLGLSLSSINSVARHSASGGTRQAGDVRAALVVAGVASLLIMLAAFTPLSELVARSGAVPAEIVRLGLVWAALQLPGPILLALLKGRERFVAAAIVELSAKAAVYGVFVAVLLTSGGDPLVTALKAAIATEALALGWRWLAATRLTGGGLLPLPRTAAEYRALFRFSGGVWLQATSSLAFSTLDKFVVGVVAGPAVLGAYAATAQIASLIHFVPSAVASVQVPRIAAAQSSVQGLAGVRAVLAGEMRALTLLLTACAIAFIVVGQFWPVWPVLQVPGQGGPLAALLVAYGVLALAIVDYTVLLGTSKTRAIGAANLAGSLVACALLVTGAVAGSLLVVALGRVGYALVCAAGLRRGARQLRPEAVPA
jgi:O-antigen/teichoic acid export membrane protein